MNLSLSFPDKTIIADYVKEQLTSDKNHCQDNEVINAVANLAATRFGDKITTEISIKIGAMLLIYDLARGEDGFTGEQIPSKIQLKEKDYFTKEAVLYLKNLKITDDEDGFEGESFPYLEKLILTQFSSPYLQIATEKALIDCARLFTKVK